MTSISSDEYLEAGILQGATSQAERPRDAGYRRYVTTIVGFVDDLVYPAWWTDPSRIRFVHHMSPEATPVTFREILEIPRLRDEILDKRDLSRKRPVPHAITAHCAATGIRVVKDGCKEILSLLVEGKDLPLEVVEVSGSDWSSSFGDMGRILEHLRKRGTSA